MRVSRPTAVIEIEADLNDRLQRLASQQHRPAEHLMADAVEQYVGREEALADFRHAGMAAWLDYENDGLHASEEAVDAWLGRLEAGDAASPPVCVT